ncbi:MAG: hypothetical protein IAF02_29315 [Anaerolineae bacterium]|nr:hypothetical protein [Anaerolineae bacterium]
MNESYFVQWVNSEGMKQVPALVNGCQSFEEAAVWAVENDRPQWATGKTRFIVHRGQTGDPETPRAEFTIASVTAV